MRILATFIFCFSIPLFGHSQPEEWTSIEHDGVFSNIRCLDYSQNLGITLYLNGQLYENGRREISGYNGEGWTIIADSIVGHIITFCDFNEGIVIGGSSPAMYVGGQEMPHVAYYDGENWSAPWEFNDTVRKLKVVNDTLFALGLFTQIDGQDVFRIAKLSRSEWVGVLDPHPELETGGIFYDIEYYQGDYYVSGNFDPEGMPQDFARIVNGNLEEVGDGLTGAWTGVGSMEVFQDRLYLGGSIPIQEGNVGSHILSWDGESFHGTGSVFYDEFQNISTSTSLVNMKKHGDYLYCAGNFHFIDDVSFYGIARWDGNEWCELYTQEFAQQTEWPQLIFQIGFFEEQLLLIKVFFTDDTETDFLDFWSYDVNTEPNYCHQPLSVSNSKYTLDFSLFPNPSSSQITIQSEMPLDRIAVIEISGRKVLEESVFPQNGIIDIRTLPAGIYLVQVQTEDGNFGVQKLVVE